jgi:hypothetical protein
LEHIRSQQAQHHILDQFSPVRVWDCITTRLLDLGSTDKGNKMAILVPMTFQSGSTGTYHEVENIGYSLRKQQIDFEVVSYVAEQVTLESSVLTAGVDLAALNVTHLYYPLPDVYSVSNASLHDQVYGMIINDPFFNQGTIAPTIV